MTILAAVEKAFLARSSMHASSSTTAYRLFGGAPEGVAGLVVDRYQDVVIFQLYDGHWDHTEKDLDSVFDFFQRNLSVHSGYLKRFVADRSKEVAGTSQYEAEPRWGKFSPPQFFILESGLRFLIRPYDGFSTGIFMDQRNHRAFLANGVAGKSVLNLFAYTCGFSVACAGAGAQLTSLDLSKKYLEWGKENFRANSISPDSHRFVCGDAVEFLERSARKQERYGLVILDPPNFSRNGREVFSVEKQISSLLEASWKIVEPEGKLFFSSNFSKWSSKSLDLQFRKRFPSNTFEALPLPKKPLDFENNAYPLSAVIYKKKAET